MERLPQVHDRYGTAGTCLIVSATLLLPTMLTAAMLIFAFFNPDRAAWYGAVNGEKSLYVDFD